jgi:hypothetical protein
MVAFDGGAVTRRGVEMVAASPLFAACRCCGSCPAAPRSDARRSIKQLAGAAAAGGGLDVEAELCPAMPRR